MNRFLFVKRQTAVYKCQHCSKICSNVDGKTRAVAFFIHRFGSVFDYNYGSQHRGKGCLISINTSERSSLNQSWLFTSLPLILSNQLFIYHHEKQPNFKNHRLAISLHFDAGWFFSRGYEYIWRFRPFFEWYPNDIQNSSISKVLSIFESCVTWENCLGSNPALKLKEWGIPISHKCDYLTVVRTPNLFRPISKLKSM